MIRKLKILSYLTHIGLLLYLLRTIYEIYQASAPFPDSPLISEHILQYALNTERFLIWKKFIIISGFTSSILLFTALVLHLITKKNLIIASLTVLPMIIMASFFRLGLTPKDIELLTENILKFGAFTIVLFLTSIFTHLLLVLNSPNFEDPIKSKS